MRLFSNFVSTKVLLNSLFLLLMVSSASRWCKFPDIFSRSPISAQLVLCFTCTRPSVLFKVINTKRWFRRMLIALLQSSFWSYSSSLVSVASNSRLIAKPTTPESREDFRLESESCRVLKNILQKSYKIIVCPGELDSKLNRRKYCSLLTSTSITNSHLLQVSLFISII